MGTRRKSQSNPKTSILPLVIPARDDGMTLIELLTAVVIGTIIMGVVGYMMSYEAKMWTTIIGNENSQSALQFLDDKLQEEFSNVLPDGQVKCLNGHAAETGTSSGVGVQGDLWNGNTIQIILQDNGVSVKELSGTTVVRSYMVSEPGIRWSMENGAVFSISSTQTIQVLTQVTYSSGTTSITSPQITTTYLLGGGNLQNEQ